MSKLDPIAAAIADFILDLLQECTPEQTGAVLEHVIRHHAINAEIVGGDDCCLFWLTQVRSAVDAAEDKLGFYIERESGGAEKWQAARDAILERVVAEEQRRAAA